MARLVACLLTLIWIAVPSRAAENADGVAAKDQRAAAEAAADTGAAAAGIRAVAAGRFDEEIAKAAAANGLPASFFTRLIWQESRFNPSAVSPVGALGIAQFMPDTARWRGLGDPLEPMTALHESARWLRELWSEFGNLGLAAAAYNAGPYRVRRWLTGAATLPAETRGYVQIVTGHDIETWRLCTVPAGQDPAPPGNALGRCPAEFPPPPARERIATARTAQVDAGAWGPWGLQLIGDWSEARALAEYRKLQARFAPLLGDRKPLVLRGRMAGRGSATWYRVRVAESTRARADELCARLERAGGKCLVFRN